jgi:predicted alpha/beta hydrolase family esterase
MKQAIIVHCWGGNPNYCWYPWVKNELEKIGLKVDVLSMPDSDNPRLNKWLPHLIQAVGEPDEELVLIGHSIGTVTIMRYLESLGDKKQVGKVILVAGFTDQLGFRELENFFAKPLDFSAIKNKSKNGFVVIQSDNDQYVSEQYGTRLKEELNAKLVIKHGAFHMSGDVDGEDSYLEVPEVIENI